MAVDYEFFNSSTRKEIEFMSPQVIMLGFAWVPYVLLSWICAKLINSDFWNVLGVLIAARLFFSLIETIGSIFSWRLYGKKKIVQLNLDILKNSNFPKREVESDDFLTYLNRIENNDDNLLQLKVAAKNWQQSLFFYENTGILIGMRMNAAANEALDIYSPKKIV